MNYLVIDIATDTIINIIVVDPAAPITPADGQRLEPATEPVSIGWRRVDGKWTAPE